MPIATSMKSQLQQYILMKPSNLQSIQHSRDAAALKERLLAKLHKKTESKGKFTDIFLSAKSPKNLLQAFNTEYKKELNAAGNQQEFREKFFKDVLLLLYDNSICIKFFSKDTLGNERNRLQYAFLDVGSNLAGILNLHNINTKQINFGGQGGRAAVTMSSGQNCRSPELQYILKNPGSWRDSSLLKREPPKVIQCITIPPLPIVVYHTSNLDSTREERTPSTSQPSYIFLMQSDSSHFPPIALKCFHKIKDTLFRADQLPDLTDLEMTADFLKFKQFVSERFFDWTDRHAGHFPDLFLWQKMHGQFLQGGAAPQNGGVQHESFGEKYGQLRIYRVIFERNKRELVGLREEFLRGKFECGESKRLMANVNAEESQRGAEEALAGAGELEEQKEPIIMDEIPSHNQQQLDEIDFFQSIMGEESTQINAPEKEIEARVRQAQMEAAIRFDPTTLTASYAATSKKYYFEPCFDQGAE